MLKLDSRRPGRRLGLLVWATFSVNLLFSTMLLAQSTSGTAGIRGIVDDQNGSPVAGAKVTITNKATAFVVHVATSSSGVYSSGPLQPGEYNLRVEAKGFKKGELEIFARVAVTVGGNLRLQPGAETETVAAPAPDATPVNTEQPTVQSVLIADQMNRLPVSGRNFMDFAQLVPGVQLQDAGALSPGKNGLSSISFVSRYGRGTRFEEDGISISDEIEGGPTQNVPASAILEFDSAQASLDLPTETTSSGVVNIATRSGANDLHGEAFGFFRNDQVAAKLPGGSGQSFQREQFGARVGGALQKDKIFWFFEGEHTRQDLTALQNFAAPFNALGAKLSEPFRDLQADGRLDWQGRNSAHAFYRFAFDQVGQNRPFGAASSLQGLRSATHTPTNTLGYDFTKGNYTHSFRFEYLRMRTGIGDDSLTIPAGVANPIPGLGINIGAAVDGSCSPSQGGAYCAGPSPFAPQTRYQSNIAIRYDGTRALGDHLFRFGATFDRIQAGGFSALFLNPQVGTASTCLLVSTPTNCLTSADPTAYPIEFASLGNGLNFASARSAFGLSGGGLAPDNQIEAYVGDSWKIKRNLTLVYGLRYVRDTGRVDSDLGSQPILNQWLPGLSNSVRNPNTNFAPQLGFAWNVGGSDKTVIRGGGGVYYDSSLYRNAWLDSRARTAQGQIAYTPQVCAYGNAVPFIWPTSLASSPVNSPVAGGAGIVVNPSANQVAPTFCNSAISTGGSQVLALSSAIQAAAASNGRSQANPNYVATALSASNANGVDVFAPDYRTPRAVQANIGFQQEIRPGMVFSVDYVRNILTHDPLIIDDNHSGAARSYNNLNALAARDKVQLANGCAAGLGQAQCVVNHLGSVAAAQAAYSAAGLDSNSATTGGAPCSFCAFPGITPHGINNTGTGGGNGALGTLDLVSTIGRSVYSGFQGKLVQRFSSPIHGVKTANLQLAYAYSKFISQDQDTDFPAVATNNDLPLKYTGPNGMDRKHQISFGGTFDLPLQTKVSFIGHFFSPLPQTMRLPELTNGGEIFASDWFGAGLGSGAPPEPVRGTQIGQFMRGSTNINTLQNVISVYNTNFAGKPTPAGYCLEGDQTHCPGAAPIAAMTSLDLQALGWVMPVVPSVPFGAAGPTWLKTFDLRAAWPIKIGDRVQLEPSASVFNVFNFANAFLPGNLPSGSMMPGANTTQANSGLLAPNVLGGVTGASLAPYRAGVQSGTYSVGAPRVIEFGLRISF
ncbi:MAG TPA: carboxypeptidase-like regulatory domain-containing protein [Candidatus Acidoferrum sp.]|nr:carboxypeptidase-like regulatory domain-containing protein [Candidatus Acidoferrum sp.]